jgi:hypothetical protein
MAKEDTDWLKALKAEAKRLGKTVHELLVEKNMGKAMKDGKMKAAKGGMVKKPATKKKM